LIILINRGILLYCWEPQETVYSILNIPVSARSFSFAGLSSINYDLSNVANNPSALKNFTDYSFSFSHFLWFEGLNIESIIFGRRNIGFSYITTKTDLEERDEKGNLTGRNSSFSSSVMNIGFSPYSFSGIDFGMGIKSVKEKIEDTSVSSVLLDFSLSFFKYYLAIRNIGNKVETGKKYPVPTSLNIGGEEKMGRFNFLYEISYRGERKLLYRSGFEFASNIFSLRAGFKYLDFIDTFFGFGIKYKRFVFDYSFSPHPYLGLRQNFSLKIGF